MSIIQNISKVHPPSVSTISDATIHSSAVVRQANDDSSSILDGSNLGNISDIVFGASENQVKIESGKNIQVGDTYHYNFYTPPTNESTFRIKIRLFGTWILLINIMTLELISQLI